MARCVFTRPASVSAVPPKSTPTKGHPQLLPPTCAEPLLSSARDTDPPAASAPVHSPRGGISMRCSVKGCIFPVADAGDSRCLVHDLADKEPKLFLSMQPSLLLLDQAKFGIPDPEFDDARARDRRRMAALREKFREEVA